jgi:hypothetical protein
MRIVIPSVDYADHLAVTLPAWQAMFPAARVIVVTAPADRATQALAIHRGARVVVTSAWYANGHTFDKAAALDEGLGLKSPPGGPPPPERGERCLIADADVYPFGSLPEARLRPNTIYGCARYLCETPAALRAHIVGETKRTDLPLLLPRYRGDDGPQAVRHAAPSVVEHSAKACLGYVQLFRYYPGQTFGSYRSAGKYDIVFRDSFPKRAALPDFYVLHLGAPRRANWRGRVQPRWGA